MIEFLRGTVAAVREQRVVIERDGIGWALAVSRPELCRPGEQVTLFVHLHWNQEQGPALFGFFQEAERALFALMISCPGVGPKLALGALYQLTAEGLATALMQADLKALSSVSGIGMRRAETMLVTLKDKVEKLVTTGAGGAGSFEVGEQARSLSEVSRALEALGYDRAEIRGALDGVRALSKEGASVQILIKKALTYLAKRA